MERMACNSELECKYRDTSGCNQNTHHEYWPRRNYKDPVAKEFRNLVINKTVMCHQAHDDLHRTTRPPKKPSRAKMLEVIDGQS